MKKTKFALIGNPVSHSLSPIMHNYWFNKYNINAEYQPLNINENEIERVIDKIKDKEIKGINVTLPYKKSVIPFLARTVNDAKDTHSVNTILLDESNNLIGENTDVFGFQAAFLKSIPNLEKKTKKVLILGAGGVAPSIILALLKSNILDISIANRTYEKSLFIKKKFNTINIIKWNDVSIKLNKFDILINATSLGLKSSDKFSNDFSNFKKNMTYIDTIYNPVQTKMLKYFKSNKIKTFNGLNMLIYQGQKSFYLWNKINPEVDDELLKLLESKLDK
jgi:shikimate dehydrogenase|tara:strand:+ start:418 stop:1251 length:834 start_codon:yes stop_codon:yes gene_type:complete